MATLTEYVSAVAEAAREVAGTVGGVAVAARQDGGEERKAVAKAARAVEGEEVSVRRGAGTDEPADSGPDIRRQEMRPPLRPLQKPLHRQQQLPAVEAESDKAAPAEQGEPKDLHVQRATVSEGEAPVRVAKASSESLVGAAASRSARSVGSVEVVLHAADDLTAAVADSDEVRETILRTVAEVLREG